MGGGVSDHDLEVVDRKSMFDSGTDPAGHGKRGDSAKRVAKGDAPVIDALNGVSLTWESGDLTWRNSHTSRSRS